MNPGGKRAVMHGYLYGLLCITISEHFTCFFLSKHCAA